MGLMKELETQCRNMGGTFKYSDKNGSCLIGRTTILLRGTNDIAVVKDINKTQNDFFIVVQEPESVFNSGLDNMVIDSKHASVIVDKGTGNIFARLRR